MLSVYNIWTVAKFEIKTLSRSWFLRIFAILSIVLLFLFNLMIFTDVTGGFIPRFFYGMSASVSYANLMLFNLAQAVIAVFLASDFLKRDKKLDTTEVIYIRSITNSDYILGKSIGIIFIFLILNIVVLLIAAVFNIVNPDILFNLPVYFYYILLISIPTLVFIIGLSFLVMTLIPNQAVTFILLIGYVATTLFYLGWNYYQVLDYTAFFIPMMYSDFFGFENINAILFQRAAYMLIGTGLIFFTMYMFKRLPQSVSMRKISLILSVLLVLGGLYSMYIYISDIYAGQTLREKMIEANQRYDSIPVAKIVSNQITLNHKDDIIECTAELEMTNENGATLDRIVINLNPGLKISSIKSGGNDLDYSREAHLVIIEPGEPLGLHDTANISIEYTGHIIDEAAYLDISNDERNRLVKLFYTIGKMYSIVSPEYVILISENLWYPQAGVTFIPDAQFNNIPDFTNFTLRVNTKPGLTVISQDAEPDTVDEGKYVFIPGKPLPKLSVSIGNYVNRNIEVDSISYNLFTYNTHNYFDDYFNEIDDTLSALIRELNQDYERELGLDYPYNSLTIVEAPVQFTSYERVWTNENEKVQPQIVFIPENGFGLDEADFKQRKNMFERFGNRSNQVILPREQQSNMFKTFVRNTFLSPANSMRFRGPSSATSDSNPYELFPNYFNFVNHVSSNTLPVFNTILADYLNIESEEASPFRRAIMGLSPDEKAVQILYDHTLEEIVSDTSYNQYLKNIIQLKGTYLFTILENKIGTDNLNNLIRSVLDNNKYKAEGYSEFISKLVREYKIDFESEVRKWYKSSLLPAYFITQVEGYKIIDEDRERYQVNFNITNQEDVDGFVKVSFEARRGGPGGRFGRMFGEGDTETSLADKLIYLEAHQSKRIFTLLDDSPGRLSINTIISKNLPLQQDIVFEEFEENKKLVPYDGKSILEEMEAFDIPGEIVVDNEDEGFKVYNPEQTSLLKKVLNLQDEEEKYIGLRMWNAPENWRATVVSEAYGKYIHSAHFTEAGEGNSKVEWNHMFEESGYYDVYVYLPKPRIPGRRRDNNSGEEFNYTVFSDDGEDKLSIDYSNADEGWNLLGSFYISADSAKVELSNKSDNGLVIADAVKWIKRQ